MIMSPKSTISLLIFCLHDLSIIERGVLEFQITNEICLVVNLQFSPCSSIQFCLVDFATLLLAT